MFIRALCSGGLTAVLMLLVVVQMAAAQEVGWLTVEQQGRIRVKGLTFDRHYAMVLDFSIVAPFVGLTLFLSWPQWTGDEMMTAAAIVLVATGVLGRFWWGLPTPEAHNRSATAAVYHGIFFAVALWVVVMLLGFTPRPLPALVLVLCIVVPAFLFVGQHMFLGLINLDGSASGYPDKPLGNILGWVILMVASGLTWWRASVLIPSEFWAAVN